jgi:hypothetical protein
MIATADGPREKLRMADGRLFETRCWRRESYVPSLTPYASLEPRIADMPCGMDPK